MPDTRSPVPVRFGSDTAGEQEFYQERLRLFAGYIFLISGGFYVTDVTFSAPALGVVTAFFWTPKLLNLTGTLLAAAIWLATRRTRPSLTTLYRLDAGGTIALSACYGLMVLAALDVARLAPLMHLDPWRAVTDPLMACSYVIVVRALIVPSRPRRTVWIGALSMLPIAVLGPYVLGRSMSGLEARFASLDLGMWSVAAVAVSAIASRVIFGLRTEVAKIRRLGQYTLEEKIGEGGMGIVYRASPAMLRRPTAIKLLRPDRMGEASLSRFEREVQLTAGLTHPNTVAIFDYGRTPDGIFYYAMEYLDGFNLDQVVARDGPQSPARVIHLLSQVCGSLAEAHGVGLIHRDIKPANILLVERGGVPDVVKVVDFGLAKRVGPDDESETVSLTTANVIQGTPLYVSPEAIRNDPVIDARSDLYAVGAVGYFLLTGAPVFRANTVVEVLSHHLHTKPEAPSRLSPHAVPPALDEILLRCLAKDPAQRPADALALQQTLGACRCEPPWTPDAAAAWWAAHRTHRRMARPAPAPEGLVTVAADLGQRTRPRAGGAWLARTGGGR